MPESSLPRRTQREDRAPPVVRGLIAAVALGTAAAAAVGTCVARQAARSADALGGVLAAPGRLPRSPAPTPGLVPREGPEPPSTPELPAPSRPRGAEPERGPDLGRPSAAPLTSAEAPRVNVVHAPPVTAPPARPAAEADASAFEANTEAGAGPFGTDRSSR